MDSAPPTKAQGKPGLPPLYSSYPQNRSHSNSNHTATGTVPDRSAEQTPHKQVLAPTTPENHRPSQSFSAIDGTAAQRSKSGRTFTGGPRRGPTKIAQTTEELIAFDRLNARDKELLEKSQVVLGLSKLYEMEASEPSRQGRPHSGNRTLGHNSANKSFGGKSTPVASKIQLA